VDILQAQLSAAKEEVEKYRAAAEKLQALADGPPAPAPAPTPVVPPLRLPGSSATNTQHVEPTAQPQAVDAAAMSAAATDSGIPPIQPAVSAAEIQQMQDQMHQHFLQLKDQVEKVLTAQLQPEPEPAVPKSTTPRDTQTSPEPVTATTPRETQTSPEQQQQPLMSPRETQTSPEQKPAMSPRETQTSPEAEAPAAVSMPADEPSRSATEEAAAAELTKMREAFDVHAAELEKMSAASEEQATQLSKATEQNATLHSQLQEATRAKDEAVGRSEQVEQQLESSRQAAAAETERLEQQVKDAEKMRDAAMEGDAGAIVEEMKQQLSEANASLAEAKSASEAATAKAEEAVAELSKVQRAQSELEVAARGRQMDGEDSLGSDAAADSDLRAMQAALDQLKAQDAEHRLALQAANAELDEARSELQRLQAQLQDESRIGGQIPVPRVEGIPSTPEPQPSPAKEWRSPNRSATNRSPERSPPRLRWTPRGEAAKNMEDRLKAKLKLQMDETEKLKLRLGETEKLIDAAMAGHTDDINNVLHEQLKAARDEARLEAEKAAAEQVSVAAGQKRIEEQLGRIADLEAHQLVHTDGQTQTVSGDIVVPADEFARLERAADGLRKGTSQMYRQCAEAVRDLETWRANATGDGPRSVSITPLDDDGDVTGATLADRLDRLIVSLTRVPVTQLQRSLGDVIREQQERDKHDIGSMPWSVLRDYAITQRQRIEGLAEENETLAQRWAEEHSDPSTAVSQIESLRSQVACKDAELYAIRGDLARFLHPASASKDDGNDEVAGDDDHCLKLEARYQRVIQAERALEERSIREHSAKRKWSDLLAERSVLGQRVEKLEAAVQQSEKAHALTSSRSDAAMRAMRLELAHVAAGGNGDPRRQVRNWLLLRKS